MTQQSWREAAVFRLKVSILQARHTLISAIAPLPRYPQVRASNADFTHHAVVARSTTPLWTHLWTEASAAEVDLIWGKIQNLRLACRQIDGLEIPAGGIFSFWRTVGRPSRARGFVVGRELRQGCLIPSVGGGLCQLSNALYSVALDAGLTIHERHAHTQIVPGSLAEVGRDATVFWNYVDLRFQVSHPTRIEAQLTDTHLTVRLIVHLLQFENIPAPLVAIEPAPSRERAGERSCRTCNVRTCSHHQTHQAHQTHQTYPAQKSIYVVDKYWPEFDAYLQATRQADDELVLPLDGRSWRKANYAWNGNGFARARTAPLAALQRAIACRHLPAQGPSLQETLLRSDRRLAQRFLALLSYDATHIAVMQNLLPFLWEAGALHGRSFDVLMTRLPLHVLQERLDAASRLHPDSPTLRDFRADPALVALEAEALRAARQLITPHSAIADLYPERARRLSWHLPLSTNFSPKQPPVRILFPASTLARKGAYEVREVAGRLQLPVTVLGRQLEGDRFWDGLAVRQGGKSPLDECSMVVLPAFVEHEPRLLLRAIARGIPVIASTACGLGDLPGVVTVPSGDVAALSAAVGQVVSDCRRL